MTVSKIEINENELSIALITESFFPHNTSASVQLDELCRALSACGLSVTVIVPNSLPNDTGASVLEQLEFYRVFRVSMPLSKGDSYLRRIVYESIMPFVMMRAWKNSNYMDKCDGIVWYSPSIFHGLFARYLKKKYKTKSYLILRDIFPEWAVDLKIISKLNPLYWYFKVIEAIQYCVADRIGVQSPGNLPYLEKWASPGKREIEVLHNWYRPAENHNCTIQLSSTNLAGRNIFVYAGNVGVAQNLSLIAKAAAALNYRDDIGFIIVGRGSEFKNTEAQTRDLTNVLCFEELSSDEIPGLYRQCSYGIVSLHHDHKTHNIPGKFISYMSHGLPVVAVINPGNDLVSMIVDNKLGGVTVDNDVAQVAKLFLKVADETEDYRDMSTRCIELSRKLFSPDRAAAQVCSAFLNE